MQSSFMEKMDQRNWVKNITKNEAAKLLSGQVIKVKLKSANSGNPYSKEVRFNKEKCWVEYANSREKEMN